MDDTLAFVGDPENETPSLPIYRCFACLSFVSPSSSFPRFRSVRAMCDRSVCSSNTWYGRPRWLNKAITAYFGCRCAASRIDEGSGKGRVRSVESESESESVSELEELYQLLKSIE